MTLRSTRSCTVLAVLSLVLGLSIGASEASALSCFGGPAASALNQYCETIPTSSGHHGPGGPGAPSGATKTLGSSLPKRLHRLLAAASSGSPSTAATTHFAAAATPQTKRAARGRHSRKATRKAARDAAATRSLLALPAATILPSAPRLSTAGIADVWSPILVLLGAMAVLGLLMGGLSFALRRRSSAG